MTKVSLLMVLVCSVGAQSVGQATGAVATQSAPQNAATSPPSSAPVTVDKDAQQNANKAKAIIEEGIQALGGQTWLTMKDREQQGRTYGFHAGRPSGGGGPFW